jgi:hypothetical protein
LLQMAGLLPERSGVVCDAASAGSGASERVFNMVREGLDTFDDLLAGRTSLSDPIAPAFAKSVEPVVDPASAAITPGGLYLPGGGLAATDDVDALELP